MRPGESVSARLVGSAALRLTVVDGATGAAVDDYSLDVGYRGVNFSPSVFRVRERSAAAPADALYTGIVPGDLALEVEAEGWPHAHATVDAVRSGRVVVLNAGVLVRPGPRLAAVTEAMAEIVHGAR